MCFHGVYAANTLLGARAAWSKPGKGHEMDSQSRSLLYEKSSDWERDVVSTVFFYAIISPAQVGVLTRSSLDDAAKCPTVQLKSHRATGM